MGDPIPYILRDEDFFPNIRAYFEVTKKKNFFGSDPRVETSGGNFVIFEALF